MIPKSSAAQIACVRARTRAAVKRLTLPPAGTRGNQTLLDSGNLVQAPVKRLVFLCLSPWFLGFLLFSLSGLRLVACLVLVSPVPGLVLSLVGLAALRRPVPLSGGACGAAVAALSLWPARKTCRCFIFFGACTKKPEFKRSFS